MDNGTGQLDNRALTQHTRAGEHLVSFIDSVLEAFQTGSGIRNNAPEPITLDIARRLIWNEIRRTMQGLVEGSSATDLPRLWMRLDGPDGPTILNALNKVNCVTWTVRCYGAREEGHTAVAYAVAEPVRNTVEAAAVLGTLCGTGIGVRDWTLGAYLY